MGFGGGQGFSGGGADYQGGGFNANRTLAIPAPSYPQAQGTYVKGHGVVYTILLPPEKQESPSAKPSTPSLSEWDRVRRQIRGENPASPAPPAKPKEPTVADAVLEVLAKNGHHFSQLGDQESLTVSIIFRAENRIRASRVYRAGVPVSQVDINDIYDHDPFSPVSFDVEIENFLPTEPNEAAPQAEGKESSEKKKEGEKPGGGSTQSADQNSSGGGSTSSADQNSSDYELLGDLHLKQGQGVDALRAYQQALAKSADSQHAAAVYLKMAQLYLTVQKDEAEAKQAMDHARELLAQANPAKKSVPKAAPAASPLPSRLIITAPKRLLDQMGAGKISLVEFKKGVTVEHLTFDGSQKKP